LRFFSFDTDLSFRKGESVSATKILWGQVITVFAIVLMTTWAATEWTAWRLGFQPELGRPWFEVLHCPVYRPPAFLWWWFAYDAYEQQQSKPSCHEIA
jgi:type IV secretory pathway TraG/TraD family ATPase VirD4